MDIRWIADGASDAELTGLSDAHVHIDPTGISYMQLLGVVEDSKGCNLFTFTTDGLLSGENFSSKLS